MEVLSGEALETALREVPGWHVEDGQLTRLLRFGSFREAIAFVNRVAELAEGLGHHPDMDIRYSRLRIAVTTHDAGGLSELDFRLARRVTQLFAGE